MIKSAKYVVMALALIIVASCGDKKKKAGSAKGGSGKGLGDKSKGRKDKGNGNSKGLLSLRPSSSALVWRMRGASLEGWKQLVCPIV